MRFTISPYSPLWPQHFQTLKSHLTSLLSTTQSTYLSIEHVGSTSVPFLPAKPIIDIDIVISSISDLPPIQAALTTSRAGYIYAGEWGIPGRHAFPLRKTLEKRAASEPHVVEVLERDRRERERGKVEDVLAATAGAKAGAAEGTVESGDGSGGVGREDEPLELPAHNLYVCVEGCLALRNHLAVRDLCRADEEVRRRYGEVKMELGSRDFGDVNEYTEAKNEVLSWILEKAGLGKGEVEEVQGVNTFGKKEGEDE